MKPHTRQAHARQLKGGRVIRVRGTWVDGTGTVNTFTAYTAVAYAKTRIQTATATAPAPTIKVARVQTAKPAPAPTIPADVAVTARRGFGAIGVLLGALIATLLVTAPG